MVASPLPVFAIFHSRFSAHSRRSLAQLLAVEPEYPAVRFGSVDVDAHIDLARLHGIQGIPAFIVYLAGVKTAVFMGERSEKRLRANIEKTFEL